MNDLQGAMKFFHARDNFILTTHENADADGIGAEIVLASALKTLGKKVRIVNAKETAPHYLFIDPDRMVEVYDEKLHSGLGKNEILVVLDTADEHNLGVISDSLVPNAKEFFAVDHHELSVQGHVKGFIDPHASSTCEMIIRLIGEMGIKIDLNAAKAAYAGIIFDTGSFIYPKTNLETFKVAVKLVESGVVPNEIYQAMYESASIGALILQKRVLSTLELSSDNRIAFQHMLKSHLEEANAGYEDAEPLINIPLRSKVVEVSILLKENNEGKLRASMRSKGRVNVADIAQSFGGGGHRTAAGFKCAKPFDMIKEELLEKVRTALENSFKE